MTAKNKNNAEINSNLTLPASIGPRIYRSKSASNLASVANSPFNYPPSNNKDDIYDLQVAKNSKVSNIS